MKNLFKKYLWGSPLKSATLIALLEVLIQVPLYVLSYPKGHIIHSIFWTMWLIICIFLQIKKQKQEKYD